MIDTLSRALFGAAPRTSTELDRYFSFRRGVSMAIPIGGVIGAVITLFTLTLAGVV